MGFMTIHQVSQVYLLYIAKCIVDRQDKEMDIVNVMI